MSIDIWKTFLQEDNAALPFHSEFEKLILKAIYKGNAFLRTMKMPEKQIQNLHTEENQKREV